MKKRARIYTDTSVIGGCFDPEFSSWSNGLMKDFQIGNFIPVLSEIVSTEIANAPKEVIAKYAELLEFDPTILELSESAIELADIYISRKILTPNYLDDARHIAIATIDQVDLLVSWNFRHIVRYDKIRLFNAINLEQGYKLIEIFSPREVTNYEIKSS